MRRSTLVLAAAVVAAANWPAAGQQPQREDVARRQYESGLALAQQSNYAEALKDFQTVAEAFPASSVADNALLEIGRYHLDVAGDGPQAASMADLIIKKYPTSDSAPHAHVLVGRIALARGRAPADLETALTSFERVPRLFPDSDAVPRALALAGETLRLQRRHDDALQRFLMVTTDYSSNPASAEAHLGAGLAMAAQGDPVAAMEEFQRVRDRWPDSPQAAVAIARTTALYRLYVRAKYGAPYALDSGFSGPARIEGVDAMVTTAGGAVYFSTGAGVGTLFPPTAAPPPAGTRPRGLTLDSVGRLVVIEAGLLRLQTGSVVGLSAPRPGGNPRPLEKIEGAVATSAGEWVIADEDERGLHRFDSAGKALGTTVPGRWVRLAINEFDEVAAIDRETRDVAVFDTAGRVIARIPQRGQGYQLPNPTDLKFDAFGHLYVLDREAVCVFAIAAGATPPGTSASGAAPSSGPTLLACHTEPERSPGEFRRATAFTLDMAGNVYIADDRVKLVLAFK